MAREVFLSVTWH